MVLWSVEWIVWVLYCSFGGYVAPCLGQSFGFVARWIFWLPGLGGFVNTVTTATAHQRGVMRGTRVRVIYKQNEKSLYLVHKLNLLSTADLFTKTTHDLDIYRRCLLNLELSPVVIFSMSVLLMDQYVFY